MHCTKNYNLSFVKKRQYSKPYSISEKILLHFLRYYKRKIYVAFFEKLKLHCYRSFNLSRCMKFVVSKNLYLLTIFTNPSPKTWRCHIQHICIFCSQRVTDIFLSVDPKWSAIKYSSYVLAQFYRKSVKVRSLCSLGSRSKRAEFS